MSVLRLTLAYIAVMAATVVVGGLVGPVDGCAEGPHMHLAAPIECARSDEWGTCFRVRYRPADRPGTVCEVEPDHPTVPPVCVEED